jgi:tetratricopeptide (TPR) repeat protein
VDSVIPGKNKFNYTEVRYLLKILKVVFLIIITISCSTTKKTVKQEKEVVRQEIQLTEDQQKEFEYLYIEGLKQKSLGKVDNAVPLFSRCIEIDPTSSAAMYELAGINANKGDFTSAMMLLEKAVLLNPDNQYYRLLLARVFQQNKRFDKAAEQYESLVKMFPQKTDYKFYYASLLGSAGKYGEAINVLDKLETELGIMEPVSLAKQEIYLQKKDTLSAREEINKLIKSNPSQSRFYSYLADMYLAEGNKEKALENYNKVLQIDPDDGFVHLSLSNYYREADDFEKAYDHIKTAFTNKSLGVDVKIQMFTLLFQEKPRKIDDKQEKELLEEMINAHLDDERPRALYVDYLVRQKELKRAREEMIIVVGMKKDNYVYRERLIFISNDMQDWQAVVDDSKAAMEYFPNQPLLYVLNAVGLLQLGSYEDVLKILDEGEDYIGDNTQMQSQYYLYRAEAFMKLLKVNEAYEMFEKLIKIDPVNYMAMNNYAYYLSERGEKLERAERLSGLVVKNNPNNATYLDTYAWVLFMRKDYRLAKFYMESAISKGGDDNPVLIEHYGDILYFLGQKEKAVENWKKAVELGGESDVLKEKIEKQIYLKPDEN